MIEDWIRKTCRFAQTPSLLKQLLSLRAQMAAAAQKVYDAWGQDAWDQDDEDFGSGGICDEVASEISGVIAIAIQDAEIDEYGHEGDDHAALVVSRGKERYVVDIPASVYEHGGGYSWTKTPDVTITPDDVVVSKL